jgi:hypothetical protein
MFSMVSPSLLYTRQVPLNVIRIWSPVLMWEGVTKEELGWQVRESFHHDWPWSTVSRGFGQKNHHEEGAFRIFLGSFLGYFCDWSLDICGKTKAPSIDCIQIMEQLKSKLWSWELLTIFEEERATITQWSSFMCRWSESREKREQCQQGSFSS